MQTYKRILLALVLVLGDLLIFFIPIMAVVAAYVIVMRPVWFKEWIDKLYSEPKES